MESERERLARYAAKPRIEKLGVKPGMRVLLIGVTDAALKDELTSAGATLVKRAPASGADMIFFEVARREDLTELTALRTRIQSAGVVWVLRPKGPSSPVSESDSMRAGKRAGLVDIKVVSFSATHSAEKYVIPRADR